MAWDILAGSWAKRELTQDLKSVLGPCPEVPGPLPLVLGPSLRRPFETHVPINVDKGPGMERSGEFLGRRLPRLCGVHVWMERGGAENS